MVIFYKAVYVNFIEQRWQKYTLFTLVEVQILVLKNTLVKLLIRFLYSNKVKKDEMYL